MRVSSMTSSTPHLGLPLAPARATGQGSDTNGGACRSTVGLSTMELLAELVLETPPAVSSPEASDSYWEEETDKSPTICSSPLGERLGLPQAWLSSE